MAPKYNKPALKTTESKDLVMLGSLINDIMNFSRSDEIYLHLDPVFQLSFS